MFIRMVEKHYGHLAPNYVADTVRAAFDTYGIGPDRNPPRFPGTNEAEKRAFCSAQRFFLDDAIVSSLIRTKSFQVAQPISRVFHAGAYSDSIVAI
jgi:hypothetical protein